MSFCFQGYFDLTSIDSQFRRSPRPRRQKKLRINLCYKNSYNLKLNLLQARCKMSETNLV